MPETRLELRLRDVAQLFDMRDPAPFVEKDIDPDAEEWIVDSALEQRLGREYALVVHVDQADLSPEQAGQAGEAIRRHFARLARRSRLKLHRLIRRGLMRLAIGLTFLALTYSLTTLLPTPTEEHSVLQLFEQGLLILGWVAMWGPLEVFLYEWWPLAGERRLYARLSGMRVEVVGGG